MALEELQQYKYGFNDKHDYAYTTGKGLNEQIVREISKIKGEPEWMLEKRLLAYNIFKNKPMPNWGADLSAINFDDITYYAKPKAENVSNWDMVPEDIKKTFDKIGIPEAEKKFLGGASSQYDCLTGDTKIPTNPEGLKLISELKIGEYVFALNEVTKKIEKKKILAVINKGIRSVFKVKVAGRIIKTTINHPFLALINSKKEGKRRGRYKTEWRYLKDLKVGDLIAIAKNVPIEGKSYVLQPPKLNNIVKITNQFGNERELDITYLYKNVSLPKKTNEDLMWLFGLFIGDGWLDKHGLTLFAIPDSEPEVRLELKKTIKKLFSIEIAIENKYKMVIRSRVVSEFFKVNGFSGTAKTKILPEWIYKLPKNELLAFLGGYLDSDGTVRLDKKCHDAVLTSVNKKLLEQVRSIIFYCSLQCSSITTQKQKYSFDKRKIQTFHRLHISGNIENIKSRNPFCYNRFYQNKYTHDFSSAKNTHFKKHVSNDIGFARIEELKYFGTEHVFDITVEDHHNFVADGIIVHNSEVVYHNLKKEWEEQGVIFTDMDSGLRKYPEIIKKYFGTIIPITDNKFAALNSAVWSGGSFVYIPEGVHVQIPLQAYFRINAEKVGQFERTLIIAERGSKCHYVEGCTAPIYSASSLHSAVVELVAMENAHIRYTTIQNWSNNVFNLVTKRAVAHKNAFVEWLDGNLGCLTGDSKIFTNNDVKDIKNVEIGDYVYSLDQNFEIIRNKISGKKENIPTDVYELRTANHRIVKATANHPFLVMRKEGRLTKIKWMRLDQIKTGTVKNKTNGADMIAVCGEIPDNGKSHKIEFQQTRGVKKIKIPISSSADLLWLLGFYTGDGWKEDARIGFAVPKTDKSREKVIRLVKKLFDLECQEHGDVTIRVNSAALKDFFDYLDLSGGAKEKRIPKWIFKIPKEEKLAFIQGYIDADGYQRDGHKNICISSANRELLEDTKILAISCGLHPLKISKWTRNEKLPLGKEMKEYTNYFLYFAEQNINDFIAFVPVLSIDYIGKEVTYDIEVDGTHNFIANGIFVHNSQITMKYPSVILKGEHARGEVISVAYANKGQCQDAGGKMIHLASNTTSRVISKSISQGGGRTSYRGLVKVVKGAKNCKSFVQCDAYMLDEKSRSDTYPTVQVDEDTTTIGHEAKVGKIGNDKLFYLMSRGIPEQEALAMIVQGFLEPFTKELPMEYAVELNRLIQIQLEGAVG